MNVVREPRLYPLHYLIYVNCMTAAGSQRVLGALARLWAQAAGPSRAAKTEEIQFDNGRFGDVSDTPP
jgi:hypothetical protein